MNTTITDLLDFLTDIDAGKLLKHKFWNEFITKDSNDKLVTSKGVLVSLDSIEKALVSGAFSEATFQFSYDLASDIGTFITSTGFYVDDTAFLASAEVTTLLPDTINSSVRLDATMV